MLWQHGHIMGGYEVEDVSTSHLLQTESEKIKATQIVSNGITSTNPADLLTRGISSSNLIEEETWWRCKQLFKKEESSWPSRKIEEKFLTNGATN